MYTSTPHDMHMYNTPAIQCIPVQYMCTVYLIHVCTCTTKCTAHEYNVHVSTYSTTQTR